MINFVFMLQEYFMRQALKLAAQAFEEDEVPVGCIVVCGDQIIGKGYNQSQLLKDATAHAEMIAITAAQSYLGATILSECEIFVTIEPCIMCAGAIMHTQPKALHFAATEPKNGYSKFLDLPQNISVFQGLFKEEAGQLMKDFFKLKR